VLSAEAGKPTLFKAEKRLARGVRFSQSNRYWPNTTLCMIRPGTSVNSPASTRAPAKIDIIVILWVRTWCPRAASTPTISMIGVNTDRM